MSDCEFKNKWLFLLVLVFLIALTIPHTPHAVGSDAFLYQAAARSIVEHGVAKWVTSPLSFYGLTPYSTPSSLTYLVSILMLLTNLEVESVSALLSITFSITAYLSMYLLSGVFFHKRFYRILAGLFYATTPLVLRITTFTLSTRMFFSIGFIYSLYFMYRLLEEKNKKTLLLLTTFLIFLPSTHRMYLLAYPVILASLIGLTLSSKISISKKTNERLSYLLVLASIALFLLFVWGGVMKTPNNKGLYSRYPHVLERIIFTLYYYGRNSGFILFLSIIGFLTKHGGEKKEYLLYPTLILSPLLPSLNYTLNLLLPLLAVYGVFGLKKLYGIDSKTTSVLFTLIIFTAFSFSLLGQYYHPQSNKKGTDRHMHRDTHNTIKYINNELKGSILHNSRFRQQIYSLSEKPILLTFQPQVYIYGLINATNQKTNFHFDPTGRNILKSTGTEINHILENLKTKNLSQKEAKKHIKKYDIKYALTDKNTDLNRKNLFEDIEKSCNRIFDNNKQLIFSFRCSKSYK